MEIFDQGVVLLGMIQKSHLDCLDCESVLSGGCVRLGAKTLYTYFITFTCFTYNLGQSAYFHIIVSESESPQLDDSGDIHFVV